jgi:hypothetical protein
MREFNQALQDAACKQGYNQAIEDATDKLLNLKYRGILSETEVVAAIEVIEELRKE